VLTLTSKFVPACKSRTNTSSALIGIIVDKIVRPTGEGNVAAIPENGGFTGNTIARSVTIGVHTHQNICPPAKSRTNTSRKPLVSLGTKLSASL